MACVSPFLVCRSQFSPKRCSLSLSSETSPSSSSKKKKFVKFCVHRRSVGRRFRLSCRLQEGENKSNGEEPPESLFMKELRKRGMTPTSILEDSKRSIYEPEENLKLKEDDKVFSKRSAVSTNIEKELLNQRERSLALNSEGLEGLIPRAKLLLTLGGTFFLAFWPLILVTVGFTSALYLYFGPSFIHDGSKMSITPPPYIEPYSLLEEERISQRAPFVN